MRQQANTYEELEFDSSDNRLLTAIKAASDKKATDIVALQLTEIASFTDYFIICSGTSSRQVQAIADEVTEKLRRIGTRPLNIEGYKVGEWILMDYGDFIIHIFSETARRFYDLERLWRDARRVKIPEELS